MSVLFVASAGFALGALLLPFLFSLFADGHTAARPPNPFSGGQ